MTAALSMHAGARTFGIASDVLRAELAPGVGASIASLRYRIDDEWVDVFRPASDDALMSADPRAMGCFPMLPYASLIHGSTFQWSGKSYRVPPNMPDRPHALHGDAWQHRWDASEVAADRITLRYEQTGSGFPFPYAARLVAAIRDHQLSLTLSLTNRGRDPMPAGMGFHPFFRRLPGVTLQFDAAHKWLRDGGGRMLARSTLGGAAFCAPRTVSALVCNDVYDGWNRTAELHWPSLRMRATMSSEGVLDRLLLFSPADRDVVCVEPISNLPDGFNLLAAGRTDSGVRRLEPGDSIDGTMRITMCRD